MRDLANTFKALSDETRLEILSLLLIEVPVMLMLVKICTKTTHWFQEPGGIPIGKAGA